MAILCCATNHWCASQQCNPVADGSLEVGSFSPVRVADAGYYVFFLALYHHLSLVARRSFQHYRPLLKAPDTDLQTLEYRLTTLPRRLGWLAVSLGLGLAILSLQADSSSFGLDVALTWWPVVYLYIMVIFTFSCMFALLIQTIRQLRLVNELHQQATEINLFQLAPAHALASLTARTGIGLVVFIVFSGLTEASSISDLNLTALVVMGILAVIVFATPLLGMRDRLKDEKARLLGETNERIQVTIGRIHDQVDSDEHEVIGSLGTAMSALVEERKLIEGISTWPWEPSTLRGFASTVLLPILLWLVTRLLERLI